MENDSPAGDQPILADDDSPQAISPTTYIARSTRKSENDSPHGYQPNPKENDSPPGYQPSTLPMSDSPHGYQPNPKENDSPYGYQPNGPCERLTMRLSALREN